MLIRKNPSQKHFAPVRGRRARAAKIKIILLALAAIAVLGLAVFGLSKLSAVFFGLGGPDWAKWRLKELKITGATADARYEVLKSVGFDPGDAITARDAANLEAMLKKNLKQLSDVKVSRGLFDKQLKIAIKKHAPLARVIRADGASFLASSGVLFADAELSEGQTLLPVYLQDKTKSDFLPQELVKLIQAVAGFKNPRITAAAVDMDTKVFFVQAGGEAAFANMGGWEDYGPKLKTLARIMQKAKDKNLKQPYDVNFNYFEHGKIYLTQAD